MNHSTDNLRHTRWECKYHVVFIPKYRKKVIYGGLRSELGPILRDLAQQKEAVVEEGTPDERSGAYAVVDTAKVLSVRGGGVYQREECDSDRAPLYGASEEFCGTTLLGARSTLCRRWGGTRPRCGSIFKRKRKRIDDWIS